MKRFDLLLEEDVKGYRGEHQELIRQAPSFYRMMTRMMGDGNLPRSSWQLVIAAIAYFIMPQDVIPDDVFGPKGYLDDIYLCAIISKRIVQEAGTENILIHNWDGDVSIIRLIDEIISRESELIGNKREEILAYVGFDELVEKPAVL
jgi:uncharacterized membrane protein YkvA (DUF1232 family)